MRKKWQRKKLGDLLEIQNGYAFDSKQFSAEGVPLIRIRDLKGGRATKTCYSGDYDARYLVKSGDFLIGMDGEFACYEWKGVDSLLNQRVCRLQNFSQALDARFLFYGINKSLKEIEDVTGFTTVKHISSKQILGIEFSFPDIESQKRIVAILDEAFEGIDTAVSNAEKNLANARELFNSYLNIVFGTEGDQALLSELATDITDGDHSPPPKAASGVPFITISDIVKPTRTIDFANTFFVPDAYFQNLKENKKPRVGDVLYTVTGATLGIPILVQEKIDFCFQRHIGLIRPKPSTNSVWLSYALLSRRAFSQATVGSTGTAQKTVSLAVLRNIKVPKIGFKEQCALAQKLDALSAETQRLEALYQHKLVVVGKLKQAILQRAFAGELTAQSAERVQEAAE